MDSLATATLLVTISLKNERGASQTKLHRAMNALRCREAENAKGVDTMRVSANEERSDHSGLILAMHFGHFHCG
jgi:hypothetical protein